MFYTNYSMLVGCHVNREYVPSAGTIAAHIRAARREASSRCGTDLRVVQIFVGAPRHRKISLGAAESAELREYASAENLVVVAHNAYVASPWRGDPDAARYIREELAACAAAGISGLVVHLPKAPIETVIKYAPYLLNPDAATVRIYLEIPAVRPTESYYETPEKLNELFRRLRQVDPALDVFGLCIDTAHLWTCGVDVSSRKGAEAWLAGLDAAIIPTDRIILHGNDSLRARGVGPDAHAPLLEGQMWGEYASRPSASGLAAFIEYASRHGRPFILERKTKDLLLVDYHTLKKIDI